MDDTQIAAEFAKLSKSQRTAMRSLVASPMTSIKVERSEWEWATRVECESAGFSYKVAFSPRGKLLSKAIKPLSAQQVA